MLALKTDYFGKLWINGKLVKIIDGAHGNPNSPMLIPVMLKAGNNDVMIKVHSGSAGNFVELAVQSDGRELNRPLDTQ